MGNAFKIRTRETLCFKNINLAEKIKKGRFFEMRLTKEHNNKQVRIFRRENCQIPVTER